MQFFFFVPSYLTPEHSVPSLSILAGLVGILLAVGKSWLSVFWQFLRLFTSRRRGQASRAAVAAVSGRGKHA